MLATEQIAHTASVIQENGRLKSLSDKMADCKFQLRLTIVGLLLVALAIEYAMVVSASVGTDPTIAADGDEATCTETAEWKRDLKDYVIIEKVSIHAGMTSLCSTVYNIKVGDKVRVKPCVVNPSSGWGYVTHSSIGIVSSIKNERDIIVDFPQHAGWGGIVEEMELESVPFKIEMGLTQDKYEVESIMHLSTNGPATWRPDDKGPYRFVKIQANKTLRLCEVKFESYPQPRTPNFQVITGIAMSNPPVRTVFKVVSKSDCASICFLQTKPACVTAQFHQATQSCALFDGFENTHDPSNEKSTIVFKFGARLFA